MEATIVMLGTVEERIKAGRVICRASLTPVRGFRRARSIDDRIADRRICRCIIAIPRN